MYAQGKERLIEDHDEDGGDTAGGSATITTKQARTALLNYDLRKVGGRPKEGGWIRVT